jgi:dihydropteroate synthase
MYHPTYTWRLRTRTLPLGERTLLMGIVNVTPDSFSDGGQFLTLPAAVDHALQLLDQGADLLDLGGESTRPGSTPIPAEEEQSRILPVLRAILNTRPGTLISVDTYHAATAHAALDAGAEIINDVSGLLWDSTMAPLLAREQPGAILMHTRGRPSEWPTLPPLAPNEVLPLVLTGLTHTLTLAAQAGIAPETIVLDPGFGFGKLGPANLTLLARLAELHQLARPLLAGTSRKRFLTAALPSADAATRLHATTASHVAAILAGAHILRVHDLPAAHAAASIADALLAATQPDRQRAS